MTAPCEVCGIRPWLVYDGERKVTMQCGCETPMMVCKECQRGDTLQFQKGLRKCKESTRFKMPEVVVVQRGLFD